MAEVFSCLGARPDLVQGRCPEGFSEVPGLPIFAPYPSAAEGAEAVTAGFVIAFAPVIILAHVVRGVKRLAAG